MTTEKFRAVIAGITAQLNPGDGEGLRYCLVVWTDDSGRPIFMGGNDDDSPRMLKMLAMAGELVEAMGGIESGHA